MHSCAFFPKGLGVRPPVPYFSPLLGLPLTSPLPTTSRRGSPPPRAGWGLQRASRGPAGEKWPASQQEARLESKLLRPRLLCLRAATSLPNLTSSPPAQFLGTLRMPEISLAAGVGPSKQELRGGAHWSPHSANAPLLHENYYFYSRPWASSHTPIFPQVGFGHYNTRDYT